MLAVTKETIGTVSPIGRGMGHVLREASCLGRCGKCGKLKNVVVGKRLPVEQLMRCGCRISAPKLLQTPRSSICTKSLTEEDEKRTQVFSGSPASSVLILPLTEDIVSPGLTLN